MGDLLLTVGIPNYNGAAFLESAIRSCGNLKLSLDEYEILVIDNMSSDNSIEIVAKLKAEIPNIRLLKNDRNIGRLSNWWRCIEEARGKYLQYLFVTDEFHEENDIDDQIRILENDGSISMCLSTYIAEYSREKVIKAKDFFDGQFKIGSLEFLRFFLRRAWYPFGAIQSNLFRVADIISANIRFNERYPFKADNIFCAEVALKREYVFFTNKPSIVWRLHKNPKRFHSNLRIEQMVREDVEATHLLALMVGKEHLKLARNYAAVMQGILLHKFIYRDLLSPESNYFQAILLLLKKAKIENVGILDTLMYLPLQTLVSIYRKIFNRHWVKWYIGKRIEKLPIIKGVLSDGRRR